jgi:L-serine deaminase
LLPGSAAHDRASTYGRDQRHAARASICKSHFQLAEVGCSLSGARCEAAEILAAHKSPVQAIADALIEHKTLDTEQIEDVLAGRFGLIAEKKRRAAWADMSKGAALFAAKFGELERRAI